MHKHLLFLLLAISSATSYSQCIETPQPKVLLIGDSWAFFMNTDQTFNNAFKNWGHSNYKFVSNTIVSENGAEAPDFMTPTKQTEIQNLINQNPSIEVIHLSIGGNDMMGDWKISMSPGAVDSLGAKVQANIDSVMRFLKTTKPGIRIVWGGYCYPNFKEVINTSPLQSSHPFFQTWQDMEFPDFLEINNLLNRFSDTVAGRAAADPQLDFVNATGLMQYTFGQSSPLGVAPGGTYAPFSLPLPLGDPAYPSPAVSMRDYFVTKDCFHLSAPGYLALIEYNTQKFYHKLFMDDFYALSENNSSTGSVSSAGTVSDSLFIGEQSGTNYTSVLSFNTSSMQDTTVQSASLFLRREALSGSNPLTGTIDLKIKNGTFGTSASVEAIDVSVSGDASGAGCKFGAWTKDGNWVRLDLPVSFLPHITNSGTVQFQVSASGFTGGKVKFSNSADADFAPVLNVKYGATPSDVQELADGLKISVYPNPVNDRLYVNVDLSQAESVEIFNLMGQQFNAELMNDNAINTVSLPAGQYIIVLKSKEGHAVQRFTKD